MKEKLLLVSLIGVLGSMNLYGAKYPYKQLKGEVIEKSAYKDILKIINEIDRQKGLNEKYIIENENDKAEANVGELDIVPVAQYTMIGTPTEDLTRIKGGYDKNDFITLNNVYDNLELENNEKNREIKGDISKIKSEKLPYVHKGSIKRFYFGNGNIVNNIIYSNSQEFENIKNKEKNNINYLIEGEYQKLKNKNDQDYRMSVEDYEKNIKNKSKKEILIFLQKKLKEKNKETLIKDGNLFVTDNGKNWKVLWSLEPISTNEYDGAGIKDIIDTNIYIYEGYKDNVEQNRGKLLLTNSKDIYLEDKVSPKEQFRIINSKSLYAKQLKELQEDKKKLSEKDFKEKWITPFEKNGKYEKAMIDFKSNVENLKKEIVTLEKEKENIIDKFSSRYIRYDIFNNYSDPLSGVNENALKKFKPADLKVAREYIAIATKLKNKEIELYNGSTEWKDKVVAAKDLAVVKVGKKVEFRGNGKINGIIDLGEGYNILEIAQQGTGKYGTNIILGPYAELHNINEIIASGGAVGDKKLPSISGKNSLALDIDKTKRNKNGELYQHAFAKSDKNIEFTNPSSIQGKILGPENFGVELMVSKLDKDEVVNMGRDLQYKSRNLGEDWKKSPYVIGKLRVDSDSIAHDIKELTRKDENGNTLLNVKIKDKIKGLNEDENKVYKSIKNSNNLGSLSDTLTLTNKKTLNGGIREEEALKELQVLIKELKENNIYSKLNKVAKDQIDIFTMIPFNNENIFENKGEIGIGGYLSSRSVENKFKGSTNSGYGVYSTDINDTFRGGLVFGGGSSNYTEKKNNKLDEVSTDSKIKGQNLYIGAYGNKKLTENLNLITGLGIEYGEYKIQRKWENNYQKFKFDGKSNTNGGNLYTGLIYKYKLENEMEIGLKGILSYTIINQGKVKEDNKALSMEVSKQNFEYIDGEFGINLSKTLYGKGSKNKLTGGIYGTYGFMGYENKNLTGKINNSSSTFEILGDKERKDGIKLSLNYDVEKTNGVLYGIEGNYKTNTNSNEITMGIKIGYIF
ncbi:Autotransporter beta-domain-containing protein [Cetobacterium ceti]|uniref:Autotransporter beta-domain-containing protein n=1 Tax=Cetobacterium ceti TaxID=180163 RepID=A0A1T4PDA2_9FUSO|nr:autotransporter outer membrane beta-barrel domain-containing protein [Cetobacterium ceti]SJZ89186.1 Autotransporter beta-domain-containing protein [Cetobacterium ceti]